MRWQTLSYLGLLIILFLFFSFFVLKGYPAGLNTAIAILALLVASFPLILKETKSDK